MSRAKEVVHVATGAWDENYVSQLDKGSDIGSFYALKGDVYVTMFGDVVLYENDEAVCSKVQPHEVSDALQAKVVARILEFQKLSTDRFYIMGGVNSGKVRIFLTIEFALDITRKYFWRRVRSFSYQNGGSIEQVARRLADNGVIEQLVEVVWRIEDMTYDEVKALIDRAQKNSRDIWEEGGMSVR